MMTLDRNELKTQAKELIRKNYWTGVFAGFILLVCTMDSFLFSNNTGVVYKSADGTAALPQWSELLSFVTSSSFFYGATAAVFLTFFFSVFVGNPMQYGARNWFYRHGEGKGKEQGILFSGFHRKQWLRISATILWRDLICILWSFLLIVPGIMKYYEYLFVPYILADHPMMSASDVMKYAGNLSKGHKMELFKIDLSFIGWFLLQIVTFDLAGIFYAGPYLYQTQSLAYLSIQKEIAKTRTEQPKPKKKKKGHGSN
ncbi:MAG: DUF975 family protein [Erysipelotrichaceae bacterium]|nr:DUF975 family protein [Erysipelotrichaceae bacterium]